MRPYIISHMMTSVDGRIDCPMVGQLSTDEYYIALEKLGPCSKLSGRITTALECSAVKEESTPMEGTPIGHKSVYVASKSDEYTIIVDTYGKLRWQEGEADGHPLLCIVSERVSEEYLETLRTLGIAWFRIQNCHITPAVFISPLLLVSPVSASSFDRMFLVLFSFSRRI